VSAAGAWRGRAQRPNGTRLAPRLSLVFSATLLAVTVLLGGMAGVGADDSGPASTLVDRARKAAADHEFRGAIVVAWREGGRLREREVNVRVADGVMHMNRSRIVGAGTRRLLKTDSGWRLLWSGASKQSAPDPGRKYRFTVLPSASVAGRPTTPVGITRAGEDEVRERLYFDRESGLMLRRDQLDDGRLMRRVAFTEISTPQPLLESEADPLPKPSHRGPWPISEVPDDLHAPKRIGDGFELLGMYGQPGGGTQLYYSDGLVGLSLFEAAGELAWDELPEGGRVIKLEEGSARVYPTAAGSAVLWEHDGVTFTCVTDAPLDEVREIAADLASWNEPSMMEEIGVFLTGPFSWG
jgi:hypothetical protein